VGGVDCDAPPEAIGADTARPELSIAFAIKEAADPCSPFLVCCWFIARQVVKAASFVADADEPISSLVASRGYGQPEDHVERQGERLRKICIDDAQTDRQPGTPAISGEDTS